MTSLRQSYTLKNSNPDAEEDELSNISSGSDSARHSTTRLQNTSIEPAEFIRNLALQNQLLACLKWLCEFQVLACIPLEGSISATDVADLARVPEQQLCRVVRMTATHSFLQEPRPDQLAHTTLSASFVTNLSLLDATIFLAETAAPASLHMTSATQRHGLIGLQSDSAYSVAFHTTQPFQSACVERPKLRRQWSAYRRCIKDIDGGIVELLGGLDWRSSDNATVVEVCAQSRKTTKMLAKAHPTIHFIVQMINHTQSNDVTADREEAPDFGERVVVRTRMPSTPQPIKDAAVYLLHLPTTTTSLSSEVLTELSAHLEILRANTAATFVIAAPLLPEPGSFDSDFEATARLRDLSRMQLTNECELEVSDLVRLVNSVRDGGGQLVVVNKLYSRTGARVALQIRYQAYADNDRLEFT